jgi:UDP-3-O-acyl N-acetylglucosamine deacetylase
VTGDALPRRTLSRPAAVRGAGLFSARPVELVLRPGDAGLVFRRVDLPGSPVIPARVEHVVDDPRALGLALPSPPRNTVLAIRGGAFVMTTEHVLSALGGMGVTDAMIDLDGPEPPIDDGSAAAFVRAIADAGTTEVGSSVEPLVIRREVRVGDASHGFAVVVPHGKAWYRYELDYGPGSPIPAQSAEWSPPGEYARAVAPARTFCLEAEARAMRAAGLFSHLSPRDLLVIGPDGPLDNTLRFPDEAARHKLLDLVGDLALLGRPIHGRVTASRSGHRVNHALARAILAEAS